MNEISIGDKLYISAKRAAEITGYARDYVGQLCREGHIDAKMVGRSWYVFEPSIRAHRFGAEAVEEVPEKEVDEGKAVPAQPVDEAQADWERPKYTSETPEMLPEILAPVIEEEAPPAEESLTDMQSAWREWFEQKQKALETPEIESPEVIEARNEAYEAAEETSAGTQEWREESSEEEDEADVIEIPLHRIEEEPHIARTEPSDEERVPIHHLIPEVPAPATPMPALQHMDIKRETAPVPVSPAPSYASAAASYIPEYAVPQAPYGRIVEERIIKRGSAYESGAQRSYPAGRRTNAPIIALLIGISLISVTIAAIGTGYASRYLRTLPSKNNPAINFLIGTREIGK